MATFKTLPRGSQAILVAGPLLLLSLFFTWQNVQVDYGPAGVAPLSLDGWDAWGLLLALLVAATITIVALRSITDVELSGDIPWANVTLALGVAVVAVAVIKNLTDVGSSWASYGFVALAGAVAAGAYLDWVAERKDREPQRASRRGRVSSTA